MHFRPYIPADFATLYAIEEACFQPPFRFSRSYMRHILASPDTATWIAEHETEMAGFAIIEWASTHNGTISYIQTLEVLPAHRGKGAATQLLHRLETSARAAAAQSIWLHVDEADASAIRLYTAQGFTPQVREENYYPKGRAALVFLKTL